MISRNINTKTGQNKIIIADECRKHLRKIYENEGELLKLLFPIMQFAMPSDGELTCPCDLFFMDVIPVTPNKTRPPNMVRNQISEHQSTALYRSIVENNQVLRVILKRLKGQNDQMLEEENVRYR